MIFDFFPRCTFLCPADSISYFPFTPLSYRGFWALSFCWYFHCINKCNSPEPIVATLFRGHQHHCRHGDCTHHYTIYKFVVVVVVAIVQVQRKLNPQINHSCCNVTLFDCCLRLCRIYRVSLLPRHRLNVLRCMLRCTLLLLIIVVFVVFVVALKTTFPFKFFSNIYCSSTFAILRARKSIPWHLLRSHTELAYLPAIRIKYLTI